MIGTGIRAVGLEHRAGRGWRYANGRELADAARRHAARVSAARTFVVPASDLPDAEAPRPRWDDGLTLADKRAKLDRLAKMVRGIRCERARAWAKVWALHCLFDGPRPVRGAVDAKRERRIELAMAREGVVDPLGGEIDGVPF